MLSLLCCTAAGTAVFLAWTVGCLVAEARGHADMLRMLDVMTPARGRIQ